MRRSLGVTALLLIINSIASIPLWAAPYAARIDAANVDRLRVGGSDAIAGIGDWAFGDGTVCAVISDPSHESDFSTTGGSLIDLGRCDRRDDQFLLFDQLRNLSLTQSVPMTKLAAEEGAGWARIVARGDSDGVTLESTYSVDAARPGHVCIVTRLTRHADGEAVFGLGGAFVNAYTLRPFVTSIASPGPSRGFVGPAFLGLGAGAVTAAAVAADTVVLVGDNSIEPQVSYGVRVVRADLRSASGENIPLPVFLLADDSATIIAVFSRPFWIGGETSLGWTQLLQTKLMDLDVGESLAYELDVVVGERADVASSLDQLLDHAGTVAGRVDDPEARIHFLSADGTPASEVRPVADGTFRARLRPGDYRMRVDAPGGRQILRPFSIDVQGTDLGVVAIAAPARIALPQGAPMRLVFVGQDGTADPRFGDDLLGFDVVGKEIDRTASVRDLPLSGTSSDPTHVSLTPGRYRVYATRGLEFGVNETVVEVRPGQTIALAIEAPTRAFDTPGWISADLHVHGARSLDSALSDSIRLAAFVAEGAEILVATDHDAVTDYGRQISEMGLGSRLATVVGLEVTGETKTAAMPHTLGHGNAFPFPADRLAYRDGVPANEGRRWREVIPELRAPAGERVLQLNHARAPGLVYHPRGFFTHLGFVGEPYDPTKPIDAWPNRVLIDSDPTTGARDIDFDAMELLNGKRIEAYRDLRADWYSLLRQGIVLTGTANSDSHNLSEIVGLPRNYVAVRDDSIEAFDQEELVRALRGQRSFGTTGPFVEVDLDGVGLGGRHVGKAGHLRVRVKAAPWVLLREIRILVDGREVAKEEIRSPGEWLWPLDFGADGFVTVEVRGEAGPTYTAVLPGFTPVAFTNPIFVDADGDGKWQPPGLRQSAH